jgi:hypothetical protein
MLYFVTTSSYVDPTGFPHGGKYFFGRGLDDRAADAPPLRFRGGSLLPPLVDIPVDGDGLTVRGD